MSFYRHGDFGNLHANAPARGQDRSPDNDRTRNINLIRSANPSSPDFLRVWKADPCRWWMARNHPLHMPRVEEWSTKDLADCVRELYKGREPWAAPGTNFQSRSGFLGSVDTEASPGGGPTPQSGATSRVVLGRARDVFYLYSPSPSPNQQQQREGAYRLDRPGRSPLTNITNIPRAANRGGQQQRPAQPTARVLFPNSPAREVPQEEAQDEGAWGAAVPFLPATQQVPGDNLFHLTIMSALPPQAGAVWPMAHAPREPANAHVQPTPVQPIQLVMPDFHNPLSPPPAWAGHRWEFDGDEGGQWKLINN